MTRLNNFHVIAYVNEILHIIGEIFVDTIDELPEADGIEEYKLIQGSVAYVVHSGELYIMDSAGKWFSNDVVTSDEI